MKQKVLPAVHEHDLGRLLSSLNMLDEIRNGKINCAICGDTVMLNNFQCIYVESGEIRVCCTKLTCYQHVLNIVAKEEI